MMVNIDADHPTTAPAVTAQLTASGVTCKKLQFSLKRFIMVKDLCIKKTVQH
jgi:hypothetical protein